MDLTSAAVTTTAAANPATNPVSTKTPEAETEVPPRIQPSKPSFSNGVLKRHNPHHLLNSLPAVVTYKECLKNHAASLGGHAVDGCGEFMPSPSAAAADPTSLKCAACGCHRNFHRREPEEPLPATHVLEYQSHHRHHPPPPPQRVRSPDSPSPPPISSSYYPSAPHMLLALSAGLTGHPENSPAINATPTSSAPAAHSNGRKRFRTKFSQVQKEKMYHFAERVGWKMQKRDEELVAQFCSEVGVDRGVLKVWMHNNKNTFGKRSDANGSRNNLDNTTPNSIINPNNNNEDDHDHDDDDDRESPNHHHHHHHHHHHNLHLDDSCAPVATNGSSSSS